MNKKDKPLTPQQVADNMRSLSWYWEQQRKNLLISLIPHDKYREISEAINATHVMITIAREKIHAIEYHASELTMHPVASIRAQLDDLSSALDRFLRAITPTPERERFVIDEYEIPEEYKTKKQ